MNFRYSVFVLPLCLLAIAGDLKSGQQKVLVQSKKQEPVALVLRKQNAVMQLALLVSWEGVAVDHSASLTRPGSRAEKEENSNKTSLVTQVPVRA